jgi:hypothetical protein
MAKVYVEPRPKSRAQLTQITYFVVEDSADSVLKGTVTLVSIGDLERSLG